MLDTGVKFRTQVEETCELQVQVQERDVNLDANFRERGQPRSALRKTLRLCFIIPFLGTRVHRAKQLSLSKHEFETVGEPIRAKGLQASATASNSCIIQGIWDPDRPDRAT